MRIKTLQLFVMLFAFQAVHAQNLEYAKSLIVAEKYNEAETALKALVPDPEKAIDAYYYLGNIYYKLNRIDTAKMFYTLIPEADRDYTSLLAKGRLAILNNDMTKAIQYFDKAIAVTKNKNTEVLYEVGDALVSPKPQQVDSAIAKLESAIAKSTQNAAYYLRLGDAYRLKGNAGKALSQYENALSFNDKLAPAWKAKAEINSDGHLFAESCSSYEKYLTLEPNDANAWKAYGENLWYAERYNEVESAFERYIELNDQDLEAVLEVCILKFSFKKYQEAIDCSKEYLLADSNNYIAWRIISWANYELKNYKEGYDASMKFWSIDEKKTNPADYMYSARLAAQLKDTIRTMFFYSEALKTDSASAALYSEYGKSLFSMRKWEDAAKVFEEKDTRFGNGALDVFYLGRCYFNLKNFRTADSNFAKFAEMQPASADGYLWRAKSNTRIDTAGNLALALPYYEKFIELALAQTDFTKYKKDLAEAYVYKAIQYSGKDEKSEKEYIAKALEMDPDNTFAKTYFDN